MRGRMTTKRERQKANRAARLERERKAAQRRRRLQLLRRGTIIAAIVIGGGVLFSVFFGDDEPAVTTTAAAPTTEAPPTTDPVDTSAPGTSTPPATAPAIPTSYSEFREQPTACGAEAPPPVTEMAFAEPEDQGFGPDDIVTATISTSCGDIVVELATADSPATVNSFAFLARQGYFDGSASHRVVPGFVVQAGDPTATGTGGPGYVVPDEFPEEGFVYDRGVVAMANSGAGTTGSQFFVVTATTGLGPQFSVLGQVIEGIEVADRISEVPRGPSRQGELSVPLATVYIDAVTIDAS